MTNRDDVPVALIDQGVLVFWEARPELRLVHPGDGSMEQELRPHTPGGVIRGTPDLIQASGSRAERVS